jgi:uroporphyrinogen-III synthase
VASGLKIWITRAEPGASRTAARLKALGRDPLVAPLLEVHPLAVSIDLDGVGALAFTSANGVRAFAALSEDRGLPVFAVGGATAEAARAAAFTSVTSAEGDVAALAQTIVANRDRFAGLVLAPGPREPAGDLVGALAAQGVRARLQAIYDTRPASARDALRLLPEIGIVLIHSPKAGERLAEVLDRAAGTRHLAVCCISPTAAAPLRGLDLKSVAWADYPNEHSLLKLVTG